MITSSTRPVSRSLRSAIACNTWTVSWTGVTSCRLPSGLPLPRGVGRLKKATMWLVQNGMANRENAAAVAVDYMHLMGLVALGHMWAQIARVCRAKLAEKAGDERFYRTKIKTGEYFMARWMPETRMRLAKIEAGAAPVMALADDEF